MSPSEPPAAGSTPGVEPEAPSDNTSLVEVLAGYAGAGFDGSFGAQDGGTVRCDACGSELDPSRLRMRSLRRMEGASDPDDMVAVVALECGVCGSAGTMVLGFGPMASSIDSDVLHALQDERAVGDLPGHAAPTETPDS